MADLTLQTVLAKRQDERYVRQLTERTARREEAQIAAAGQVDAAQRARAAQEAQAAQASQNARSLDTVQRQRDEQLASDLRRIEQDRLATEQRLASQQAAQDQYRVEQRRQDDLRAAEAQYINQAAYQPQDLDADQPPPIANDDTRAFDANGERVGENPNRGVIVDLLA